MSSVAAVAGQNDPRDTQGDPLFSWNDGDLKDSIVKFVNNVTNPDSPDFVPPPARIAVFDNDGTLWTEQPLPVQAFFAFDRMKFLAEETPALKDTQPFKAFLERDVATIRSLGKKGLMEFMFTSHDGRTPEDFRNNVSDWFNTAKHPLFKHPFKECVFKPQIELLGYLRVKGFKTYIVSGGGVEFMRTVSEEIYGIPPEQVIGSSVKTKLQMEEGKPVVLRIPELNLFDDREVKVLNIDLQIGRRPVFAFGNSDGDLRMLQYTLAGDGARMSILLHHDDAEREAAYDKDFKVSPLDEALRIAKDEGITVVSMKNDWNTIFAFD